jgi:Holliday junction resolvase RusA-like endonuclease
MVRIKVETSNCKQEKHYVIEELATAEVTLELQFEAIISAQSRNERKQELIDAIHEELAKFTWLISGSVQIEFAWYLPGIERQETDKVGDIDNITKPILDALTGPRGILIDDSQIGSIHTFWMSRDEQLTYSVLRLQVQFSNDDCLKKENLVFIRYWNAMCVALNIDFTDRMAVFGACVVVQSRKRHRRLARRLAALGAFADQYLVGSTWDFHRTRVGNFPANTVLTVAQLLQRVAAVGLDRRNSPRLGMKD